MKNVLELRSLSRFFLYICRERRAKERRFERAVLYEKKNPCKKRGLGFGWEKVRK
jgi:hypothetical protein